MQFIKKVVTVIVICCLNLLRDGFSILNAKSFQFSFQTFHIDALSFYRENEKDRKRDEFTSLWLIAYRFEISSVRRDFIERHPENNFRYGFMVNDEIADMSSPMLLLCNLCIIPPEFG